MKRFFACLGLVSATTPACADQEGSLTVIHAAAWSDSACTVDASTDVSLTGGLLDLSFGTPYVAPLVLSNNLQSQTGTNSGIDDAELQLRDVDVTLAMPQAPEVIDSMAAENPAYVSFTAALPADSIAPGERKGALVELISSPASIAMGNAVRSAFSNQPSVRLTVEATVVFHAERSGNTRGKIGVIDARDYRFPISVCLGCLLDCKACPDAVCPADITAFTGGVCGSAQDFLVVPATCSPEASGGGGGGGGDSETPPS